MPFTYNGVGTRYNGKKNVEIRPGVCRSCGRHVQLESYDTRLWFVILYIPIIPLGRKRILDACPACRRHYVSDLDKWETARQLETSGAMDKYRSNPTPENAIAAHQQLIGFHQVNEATEFQKTVLEKFSDNAKVQAYLGSAMNHIGRNDQAVEFFKRALSLRPDLPEARVGIARAEIREGRLDEARKHLDFLEKPGAAQLYSLEPLEILAHNYQNRSQHREAMQLFEIMQRELPKIAEHPNFRKAVKKSEKALGQGGTILPKQPFSFKRWWQFSGRGGGPVGSARGLIGLGALAAIVILGFGISNEYIRHHRKIYLVNGFDAPATVEISGAGSVHDFRGMRELVLPEGHYHAVISGPAREEVDFDVRDSYFSRWGSDRVWLINVGGGALLEMIVATYSQTPQPPIVSFHTGSTFEEFASVDHPFTTLPDKVQVSDGGSRTLTELEQFKGSAMDVFGYYEEKQMPNEALELAENWLHGHPNDSTMLRAYSALAEAQHQRDRVDRYLTAGLPSRPVRIQWHRVYQELHDHASDITTLVDQYDKMLAAEPTNSALLYLRGRIEKDRTRARDYFQMSMDSDAKNPFPAYALGYDRMSAADWSGARPLLVRAAQLSPRDRVFGDSLFCARMMLGEASQLEQEERAKLQKDNADFAAAMDLMDTLSAEDKNDEVMKTASSFVRACRSKYGKAGERLESLIYYHAYYITSDFKKLESTAAQDSTPEGKVTLAVALLEQGRADEAAKTLPPATPAQERLIFDFALADAYHEVGNESASSNWRSRGIELLEKGSLDEVAAAALLKRDAAPTRAEAEVLSINPTLKALILIGCAQQHPQSGTELIRFARDLNSTRTFPHHFVQRLASAN